MAAETTGRRRRGRVGWRAGARPRGYGRAALLSLIAAAGVAGVAWLASRFEVATGTISLFALEEWPFWAAGLALALGVGLLTGRFAAIAPRGADDPPSLAPSPLPTRGLLPAVATFGGVLLVSIYHSVELIALAPAILAPALGAILVARYHLDDPVGRARRVARMAHVLLTHAVAFLALATIYIGKVRSLLSASLVALVVCLLLAQIADGERYPTERRLIYAIVGGAILGEITWALNYWPLTGWTGGAVLLIAFYLIAGLILAQIREGLRRRDLLEYGLGAATMFAVVAAALWR